MILESILLQDSSGSLGLCCYGFICLIQLAFFAIWIYACFWVYKDAESKGQSGVLWLLIVLVAGLLGLIIYLILRDGFDRQSSSSYRARPSSYMGPGRRKVRYESPYIDRSGLTRTCRKCTKEIPYDSNMCPYCGSK